MEEFSFITYLGEALIAALLGGVAARMLKMPLVVGYLLAGILIGPNTPGYVAHEEAVNAVAKLGVALLMFAVGVHFSIKQLLSMKRVALLGGGAQILGTILLGTGVGALLGWETYGGIYLGCALALSSTAVMMHLLEERGELGSSHGGVMLGYLVVQDISLVLMIALLPALSEVSQGNTSGLLLVGFSLLQAALYIFITLVLALRGVPYLLERVVRLQSQELLLLAVVSICLTAAFVSHQAGLSWEIGAFLAGIVISESPYSHEVLAQIRPLRDVFASLFFVSVGMLLDPSFALEHWAEALAVVLAILFGKSLIAGLSVYALGYHGRTALLVGLGLAQIGEFSFVLASIGSARGLIPGHIAGIILTAALVTILLTPFVYGVGTPIYCRLNAIPSFSRLLNRRSRDEVSSVPEGVRAKALILGCGRIGAIVLKSLTAMKIPFVVVDYDHEVISRMRARGIPTVFGDASSEGIIKQALMPDIELAVVALPDIYMTELAVSTLRRLRPDLRIIARVHRRSSIAHVIQAGADVAIHAEFEAATAIIQSGLDHLGIPDERVDTYVELIRRQSYPTE